MKKSTLFSAVIPLLFLSFCPTVKAQVLWYGDPNQDVRTVFQRLDPDGNRSPVPLGRCVDDPNNPPQVSNPIDPQFGKTWRLRKPRSRKRAEFARTNGLIPQEGKTYYVGWRWKITSPDNLTNGFAVFQWKTDPGNAVDTQNYPFNLGYDGTTLTLSAYGPGDPNWTEGSSITNRRTVLWTGAVRKDQWVSIVIGVKVSRDPNIGYVEFWFNGSKQTLKNADFKEYQVNLSNDRKRAYHKTNDGSQVYMKWGVYGESVCDRDVTVNFDDMRVATTYAAARPTPANGNPPPSDNLAGTYTFRNVATGLYLDSEGTSLKASSGDSGYDKQWILVPTGGGFYNIDCRYRGRGILDTNGNREVVNSTRQPATSGATNDDRIWQPESLGNNIYRFKNGYPGRDYLATKTSDNTIEYTPWNGYRSQWELIPVGANGQSTASAAANSRSQLPESINVDGSTAGAVYPNPVAESFTVVLGQEGKSTVEIYSMTGQLVYTQTSRDRQLTLNRSLISHPGVYLLKITDGEGHPFVEKLVVE